MLQGAFVWNGVHENRVFDLNHSSNRDDSNVPYLMLRTFLMERGVQISTPDMIEGNIDFYLYWEMPKSAVQSSIHFVGLMETPHIRPLNARLKVARHARQVFTWRDDLLPREGYTKINFPNVIHNYPSDGWDGRDLVCCLIAGNKAAVWDDGRELYSERVRLVRWFEENAPSAFRLYGPGWNSPIAIGGRWGKIVKKIGLQRAIPARPLQTYAGTLGTKGEVLRRTRYAICYENVRDFPGYITEKIFDAMKHGCVPVYWGANNVHDYIPSSCFIDRRDFSSTSEMYLYISSISERSFLKMQDSISMFMSSELARPFSSDFFVETVGRAVCSDLGVLI